MSSNPWSNRNYRKLIRQSLNPVLYCLVACCVSYVLFSRGGIIFTGWEIDLGFLVPPLLGYFLFRLCSRLSGIFLRSIKGQFTMHGFNLLALGFSGYFFFSRITIEFQRIQQFTRRKINNSQTVSIQRTLLRAITG